MKRLTIKSFSTCFLVLFCWAITFGAAKPKPAKEKLPDLEYLNSFQDFANPASTYLPSEKKKQGFFKSLFQKKKKSKKRPFKTKRTKDVSDKATLSAIFGGLSLGFLYLANYIPQLQFGFFLAVGLAVLGLVFGIGALKNSAPNKGAAITGIVLSGLTITFIIVAVVILFYIIITLFS